MELKRIGRVLVAHNPIAGGEDPSSADVLAQVELVGAALADLSLCWSAVDVTGWRPWERLGGQRARPAGNLVFNLVEAPPGVPAVHPATAAVFELMRLPFTGSSAAALWLTTDKIATRALLAAEGLPVAAGARLDPARPAAPAGVPPPWIVKPACEDASLGLEGDAVCRDERELGDRAARLAARFPGQALLVEHFLPGRELNVSLLAGCGAPGVQGAHLADNALAALPVAEIVFESFPPGVAPLVSYEAKWEPGSFAYQHTVRRFPAAAHDAALLARVSDLALAAARVCGLSGYGRVDVRLDEGGEPRILEVNANPCLAADAGFMAAAGEAGLTPAGVVTRILSAALADHAVRCRTAAALGLALGTDVSTALAAARRPRPIAARGARRRTLEALPG